MLNFWQGTSVLLTFISNVLSNRCTVGRIVRLINATKNKGLIYKSSDINTKHWGVLQSSACRHGRLNKCWKPHVTGFDDHDVKSVTIRFKDVNRKDCDAVGEQKEMQSKKHQHTPEQQRHAQLFTNHVNAKTKSARNSSWPSPPRHRPRAALVAL